MLYALLALLVLGVWMFCLLDVLTTEEGRTRGLPKFGWFLIVLLGFEIGAVLWLLLGRPRGERAAMRIPDLPRDITGDLPAGLPSAPRGPDDDPEFLRSLERRIRGED